MTRVLLGACGVAVAGYGGWLLLDAGLGDVAHAVAWLAGGVVAHDLVLAPLVVAVVAVGGRLLPAAWRGPAAAGVVVLGSVTLLAVPVLGRFGAAPDNPTLLDRDYWAGWAAIAGLTLLGTAVTGLLARRRTRSGRGPGAGR
jgi:hypothetical protein